ncbi:hypothetical protein [Pseudoduganella umbonata]|uniref:Uncharacterized protein n=1 Tax=Pseudoduganella umbonata TaxID=864828 RepID=A0A4P8HUM9_9BURK|nr:hypothetical protein [Pseudoduganella umbonata]MBB3222289.1 hypothetical protein [Pseudoduganella umbonata]QCP12512.1 hypothetical protein FCL38_20330 [Pseudoduganella umbonata]
MAKQKKSKIELIRSEYDKPELARQLAAMRADEQRRVLRKTQPGAIVTASRDLTLSKKSYWLKPIQGSVMLFWGRQCSDLIPALERAYATGDEAALERISAGFADQFERRPVVPLKEGFEKLFATTMYFDLVYGAKQLISRLALPDGIEYGAVGFAYNGGSLRNESFALLEYSKPFERQGYETLIVKVPPELSEIEREALALVPPESWESNIGHATMCPVACVGIAAIVIALVTCAGGCAELERQLGKISLTADQLRQLGPLSSASELLAVRREVFEQYGF